MKCELNFAIHFVHKVQRCVRSITLSRAARRRAKQKNAHTATAKWREHIAERLEYKETLVAISFIHSVVNYAFPLNEAKTVRVCVCAVVSALAKEKNRCWAQVEREVL